MEPLLNTVDSMTTVLRSCARQLQIGSLCSEVPLDVNAADAALLSDGCESAAKHGQIAKISFGTHIKTGENAHAHL